MTQEVKISNAIQVSSTEWEIISDKGVFKYFSDSGDILNLVNKTVDADILDDEIKFISVPVYVPTDEDKASTLKHTSIYRDKMENGSDLEFSRINDMRVGKLFCLSSKERRSPKSSWLEMTLMDAKGRIATARLFTEDFVDYTNKLILTSIRPDKYGFILEESSILDGIESSTGKYLVQIEFILRTIKRFVNNEKILNFFNEDYFRVIAEINAGIELEKLVYQFKELMHASEFMEFNTERSIVFFLVNTMLLQQDMYVGKENVRVLDTTTKLILATVKEKIFSPNVISLFVEGADEEYVEKSIVRSILELSNKMAEAKYYFKKGVI